MWIYKQVTTVCTIFVGCNKGVKGAQCPGAESLEGTENSQQCCKYFLKWKWL